ncbi:hypothetical protein DFH08DRAFT_986552 [Mycena albidolilacea]|uniref:Uncharacterized protein n=1 Tax=Mycena albidolilacea TaxID=1033008 RepID=A0AAD6Z1E5_9AGAR|nr:hypothetical protein DFH08DRAFT_986552 [Mycena albidolilacea]
MGPERTQSPRKCIVHLSRKTRNPARKSGSYRWWAVYPDTQRFGVSPNRGAWKGAGYRGPDTAPSACELLGRVTGTARVFASTVDIHEVGSLAENWKKTPETGAKTAGSNLCDQYLALEFPRRLIASLVFKDVHGSPAGLPRADPDPYPSIPHPYRATSASVSSSVDRDAKCGGGRLAGAEPAQQRQAADASGVSRLGKWREPGQARAGGMSGATRGGAQVSQEAKMNTGDDTAPRGSGGGYSGRSEGAGAEKRSEHFSSTRL